MFRLSKVKGSTQGRKISMRLNKSTDYAIQMLLYLAKAGKTVSSSKLAAAIGVSHRYLLQISAKLRAAGFIRAAHGPIWRGGIGKVIIAMEGIIQTGEICGVPSDEVLEEMLMLKNEYRKVDCMLERELKAITLARILEVDKKRDFSQ